MQWERRKRSQSSVLHVFEVKPIDMKIVTIVDIRPQFIEVVTVARPIPEHKNLIIRW